jgi:ketol-acid reductoisomerase
MKLHTEADVSATALANCTIAVIGYGSQGRAHALNLRDSGFTVLIGARSEGASWQQARDQGFKVAEPAQAAADADLIALLTPDMAQPEVYQAIESSLRPGAMLLFAHGFNVHFGAITPRADIDVVLIAPKGPGDLVRRQFQEGRGVPCLRAIEQDFSGQAAARALAYAHGIGGTRGGVLDTTFAEETETDLFGEQAVLCGGVAELVTKGFETLVEAGYQPEVAYFECMHELKLIVDLLHEGGLGKMYQFISETATYGDLVSGPRVVNEDSRENMRAVLADIQNGNFARQWMAENKAGRPNYEHLLKARNEHPVEAVGRKLRERMSWLDDTPSSKGDTRERAA